ncbi:MAG: phosphocholine cytidylyltransferase family protein [Gammaproteobacteria bacterium]|nr:phosphocholine cytidylyltransferase family protein [Gammaproteobacteria bacterium]
MTVNKKPKAIILLAGMGSRLGRPRPKSLTPLGNGETILSRQLRILKKFDLDIVGVVGFKKDLIMEAAPELLYCYNPNYDTTNTSKSLLYALSHFQYEDVLWLNGDVVFEPDVIKCVLASDSSAVAANTASVAEEEIKYTLNADGFIQQISKQVSPALGEALGINLIRQPFVKAFCNQLMQVDDNDYFERAMELLIEKEGNVFKPVDVTQYACIEVDFNEDLEVAKKLLKE